MMKNFVQLLSRNTILALLLSLIGFLPARVMGATISVTNTNDNLAGSLRQAIQDANPLGGDTIVFNIPTDGSDAGYNPATGVFTITLTGGEIAIGKNVTISGAGKKIVVQRSSADGTPQFRIFNITAGTVVLANLTIRGGDTHLAGGAGGVANAGHLTMRNCAVADNGGGNGGGLNNAAAATATLTNCTFAGNAALFGVGGIYNNGSLKLDSCTIARNGGSSGGNGGIVNDTGGTAHIRNTIVAGNLRNGYDNFQDVNGTFISDGYNLIGEVDGSSGFGTSGSHDQIGTTANPGDARLGPLQDNGGSTATMALQSGSPAIDQGNTSLVTDQRGKTRPIDQPGVPNAVGGDASDIGACESGLPTSYVVVNTNNSGTGSLRGAILNANDDGTAATITFKIPTTDPGYNATSGAFTIGLTTGELVISNSIAINGPPAGIEVRRNVASEFRIFDVTAGTVSMSNLTIANGSSRVEYFGGSGTGIRNTARLTVRNCTLWGNQSVFGSGGGIYNGAILTVENSTFVDNDAHYSGGGIDNDTGATATVSNCTFFNNDNVSSGGGGAICNNTGATLTVSSSTLSGNKTSALGGGIRNFDGGVARIRNTIIIGNTASNNDRPDVAGTFTSEGYNIVGNGDLGDFTALGDQRGIALAAVKLGPLQDNGGPTQTMALKIGSIAIDKGNRFGLNTDQRGKPRPVDQPNGTYPNASDGSDVGAFEVGVVQTGSTLTVNTLAEHDDGACTVDDCTLLEALNAANVGADANIVNFKPGLSGTIKNTIAVDGLILTNPVTINGPGARVLTISGDNHRRIFNVGPGVTATISGLTIANGYSLTATTGSGGAIFNEGVLTLLNCAVLNNSGGSGGGVANHATLTVRGCTFAGNTSTGYGGAIRNVGTFTATNSTFQGNISTTIGAIASIGLSAQIAHSTLSNCTVSGNGTTDTTNGTGGGLYNGTYDSFSLDNTIVAGNTSATGPDVRGDFISNGFNLIGKIDGAGAGNFISPGDLTNVAAADLKLDTALKNNGGPTDTLALLSGSPAIDAGDCGSAITTDQRGRIRPFDAPATNVAAGSDIGAFEFGPASKVQPDALIRTAAESVFIGNNIYNGDGTNQTRSTTVQAGNAATYFIKLQNDGNVIYGIKVQGTAGGAGWTVQYFDGATGRNITADVIGSSGWWIPDLPVGGSKLLRLKVTPAATVAGGTIKNVLVTASSLADPTKKDVVKATTTVASSAASQ